MPEIRRIKDVVLYRDSRYYAAFPSVVSTASDLLVLFRRAPDPRWLLSQESLATKDQLVFHVSPRSHIAQVRMDHDLNRLSEARVLPMNVDAVDQDPSLLSLRNGRILVASFGWYPMPPAAASRLTDEQLRRGYGSSETTGCLYFPWGSFVRTSDDGGTTWSDQHMLAPVPNAPSLVPGKHHWPGGFVRGRVVEKNGELLLATYGIFPNVSRASSAHLFASRDGGVTWSYRAPIAADERGEVHFHEPSLCLLEDGSLIAFIRTAGLEDHLVTCISKDDGRSWLPWQKRNVVGSPYDPVHLADGRIALIYGYRHKPYGIRGRILDPNASNIDQAEEFVIRDDGLSTDIGYPWSVLLPNGNILIVYYWHIDDGIRHIVGSVCTIGQ